MKLRVQSLTGDALHEALPESFFQLTGHSYEFSAAWIVAASLTALVRLAEAEHALSRSPRSR